ncbi:MAG: ZIP family metal transporter [Verrucomicrobiales bacterium]
MSSLATALTLGLLSGLSIPIGAWLGKSEAIKNPWLKSELRHFIMAFGGGALLSAVALVLVPEGSANLPIWHTSLAFTLGAVFFAGLDILLSRLRSQVSQLVAMLSDFLPEAIALGATIAHGESGLLLAFLIALQNIPEGFNAYQELESGHKNKALLITFSLLALAGPLATWTGHSLLADYPLAVSSLMLFAAGGILYLIFQDIAPQAKLKRHWLPPLGAVAGFLLGLIGHLAQ